MTTFLILLALGFILYKGYYILLNFSENWTKDPEYRVEEDNKKNLSDGQKISERLAEIQLKLALSDDPNLWKRIYIVSKEGMKDLVFETIQQRIEIKIRRSDYLKKYYIQIKEDNFILLKMEVSSEALAVSKDIVNYIENSLKEKSKIFRDLNENNKIAQMSPAELTTYRENQKRKSRFLALKHKKIRKELSDEEKIELVEFEKNEAQEIQNARLEKIAKNEEKKKKQIEEKDALLKKMNESHLSVNVGDYIIDSEDFRRNSEKELFYRRKNKLFLFKLYDNKCAKCGDYENGVDIDHFAIPKSKGGSFVMKTKNGLLVNNALPLCEKCNRAKTNKDYRKFFTDSELSYIFDKNKIMNNRINESK